VGVSCGDLSGHSTSDGVTSVVSRSVRCETAEVRCVATSSLGLSLHDIRTVAGAVLVRTQCRC